MKDWGPAILKSAIISVGCLVFSIVLNVVITTVGNDPVGDYERDHKDESHDDDGHDDETLGVVVIG